MTKKRTWLKKYRNELGYSTIQVAKLVDITQQFYWYIENGQRRPSPQLAQKIAKLLGFDWKLFFEDPKQE